MSDPSDPGGEAGQALVHVAASADPVDDPPPARDAHGHDPALYEWVPVLRRPRKDGWTPQRQRDFIAALADTGCVADAARAIGMSERSCYRLRRESAPFAAAWEAAVAHAAHRLVDLAFDRAIHGSAEPVFDREGNRIGRRMRYNDRLLMFLLRAYLPQRFRHADRAQRHPAEPSPPVAEPIAQALRLLEPEPPEAPHRLMAPDALADALDCAAVLDGALPHWHRGRGDAAPGPDSFIGPDLERDLTDARRANAGLPPLPEAGGDRADEDDPA